MSYETNYYEKHYNQVDENNTNNSVDVESWRLQTLYTDTKDVYALKTHDEVLTFDKLFAQQTRIQTHPSSVPVIVKDTTRPYTYYTMKSYGQAQENNYYVNFDDHVSGSMATATMQEHCHDNAFNADDRSNHTCKPSFNDSGCVKTYLSTLLGCFICCLFQFKPV